MAYQDVYNYYNQQMPFFYWLPSPSPTISTTVVQENPSQVQEKRKTKGGTDLFGRLRWDEPSVTIRTEFFKPEKGRYLHPEANRPITHREAARIQCFPDEFTFRGSKISIAKQIGNAVPVKLASAIAQAVKRMIYISELKSKPETA